MPIELTCPGCGKQLRLADEHAGKAGRCPACQTTFTIPGPDSDVTSRSFDAPFSAAPAAANNPFASYSGESPFQTVKENPFGDAPSSLAGQNPYSSPTSMQYPVAPGSDGEGYAKGSVVLGIITICSAVFSLCCCLGWMITFPAGITGIVLAYQAPPHRRNLGLILNCSGMALVVLVFVLQTLFVLFGKFANN